MNVCIRDCVVYNEIYKFSKKKLKCKIEFKKFFL